MGGKRMKFNFFVGNDIGNSELDMYVDGKLIRQPNVYAAAGNNPWADDDLDVQKNLKNIYDNLVVSIVSPAVHTGLYLIGKHALKTVGENVVGLYVKGNYAKSDQEVPYINTLAVIAARAVEKAYAGGKDVESIELVIDMATALPVKQHTPANIEKMNKKFTGASHNVTVHLGVTKKVDVKINFDSVQILSEGTPPVFALQLDREGNWRNGSYSGEDTSNDLFEEFIKTYNLESDTDGSYLDGKNLLHVDVGDGTTDDPYTIGDRVDKDFCSGINHGVGHAIQDAVGDLISLAPHAFNSISRQQYSDILKSQFSNRPHKFLAEALQAFNPHCENQVNQIIKHVSDQVLKIGANEIDVLTVYGGGSILMRNQLYPRLKKLADDSRFQLLYVPSKYAVTLNAEGLDYFVRSEIFKSLKDASNTVSTPSAKKQIAASKE
jgi:plasmid segregation protein ParM